VSKRVLVGRKLRSSQLGDTLLPKRIALPVFASDALSSVAYAPDEILLMLAAGGAATAYMWSWKIALAVALVMLTVVASYRQNVHAYPSGGGDYEVATVNLGQTAGVTVASALLVDYVLTVAVSVSAGVDNASAALGFIHGHEVTVAVLMVALLATLNLRGVKESGTWFAIPTYGFMLAILGTAAWGFMRQLGGTLPPAESADFEIIAAPGYEGTVTTVAFVFLLARAFSSGCAALTGVEAIANGVPAFRKPKSRNAATTLLLLGCISITMMISIISLARVMELKFVDPQHLDERLSAPGGGPLPEDYQQHTVIAQIARGVFDDLDPAFYFVIAMTGVILILAANTAFNGFPVLASILAKDGLLPRQLASRGDRLAYSNGIVILALMAMVLIWAFDAEVTRLIQLYIVGVFVSFNASQLGMIRHWTRHLKTTTDPGERRAMMRSRAINSFGLAMTAVVLVIVLVTKFLAGAWIAILAMGTFFMIMQAIRRHYEAVARELTIDDDDQLLPTRVHAIVLVSRVHKPTLRALAYADATRPNVLEAVMVATDPAERDHIIDQWDRLGIQVPLKILDSPYREVIRPIVDYTKAIRAAHPRGVVAVFVPEYVVGRWWEQLLHNQTALRLKTRLLFTAGVMMTSVPYQLRSTGIETAPVDRSDDMVGQPTDDLSPWHPHRTGPTLSELAARGKRRFDNR
jgi:amino acid transporter